MENGTSVKITDINMPFKSMVIFMVKWAVASIPAMVMLGIVGTIIGGIFGGLIF